MIGLVWLVVISSVTVIMGNPNLLIHHKNNTVQSNPSSNRTNGTAQQNSTCAYNKTSQSCPALTPINGSIEFGYLNQPCYVTFAPREAVENIDNICYTLLPLPDNNKTYQLFISTVYCNGTNTVDSWVVTQNTLGTYLVASPQCTFFDIVFDEVTDIKLQCDTGLLYRCVLYGDCPRTPGGIVQPVFGMSFVRQKLPQRCWSLINDAIESNGLGGQDYLSLPMNLPSQCVFSQACSQTPIVQSPIVKGQRSRWVYL